MTLLGAVCCLAAVGAPTCAPPTAPAAKVSASSPHFAFTAAGVFLLSAAAADQVTTEVSLARGNRELNPLMRARAVRVSAGAAAAVAAQLATRALHRRGHPRLATVLRFTAGGLFAATAARNLWVISRTTR